MVILAKQMLILFLIMMVGFISAKVGWLEQKNTKTLSALVVNVANPAMIVASGLKVEIEGSRLLTLVGMSVVYYVVLLVLAAIIPHLLRLPKKDFGPYRLMTVFSNIGFMGIPLVSAMYGAEAVLAISVFNIVYNILIYTYGISQMKGKTSTAEAAGRGKEALRRILNIGVITSVMAMIFAPMSFETPEVVTTFLTYLGNLTAPLSMMVIGASFVGMRPKELFLDWRLDVFACIKLLVIPCVGLMILRLLGMEGMMLGVFLVLLATPVGSMTAMLSQQYSDDATTATRGVALTTLLSVLTMTICSVLLV